MEPCVPTTVPSMGTRSGYNRNIPQDQRTPHPSSFSSFPSVTPTLPKWYRLNLFWKGGLQGSGWD